MSQSAIFCNGLRVEYLSFFHSKVERKILLLREMFLDCNEAQRLSLSKNLEICATVSTYQKKIEEKYRFPLGLYSPNYEKMSQCIIQPKIYV